jgi:rhodanese-related sulfurtransferase
MQNATPLSSIPLTDDRRRFLHHLLCQAQLEFNLLESPSRVIDGALLTALGALGAVCGFSGWRDAEDDRFHVSGRGLDAEAIAAVERNVDRLMAGCFETWQTDPAPLFAEVRIIVAPPSVPALAGKATPSILIGWRMATRRIGLMGIGAPLKDRPFADSEIDFLYHLADHMLLAMRAIADKARMHGLQNELDQARQKIAQRDAQGDTIRMELEETRFRLTGFNDIFHELSGLTDSRKVMDAFLLVLIGIFSAQSGAILFADDTSGETHAATRGNHTGSRDLQADEICQVLGAISGPYSGSFGKQPPVTVLPPEQCKGLDRLVPETRMAIFFRVDADASGVICLGKRLVEPQYGAREQELLLAFIRTFLAFLKNSRSFETITRLHADQQQKTITLEKTVQALSESRLTIASLERAGERIKATISRSLRLSTQVSLVDILMIMLAGIVLGAVYNYASPTGIPFVPDVWRYPPPTRIGIDDARVRMAAGEILLVDARPKEFYNQGHIHGALSLPLALFDFVYMMRFSRLDPSTPIVVYGRNVSRLYDEELAYKLSQRGHARVFVLTGGLKAWQTKELEVSP